LRPAALLVLLFALLPALAAQAAEEKLSVMPTGGLRGETAALLLSGQEGGGLPMAVLALPFPGTPGQTRVSVVVEMAGPALLAGLAEGPPAPTTPLDIEICLYALGPRGGIVGTLLDTVEIAPEGFAELKRSGLAFQAELLLPPGETSLRVLVRNPETGAMGLRRLTLAVPAFQEGATILSPPLLAPPGGAWVVARAAEGVTPVPGTGEPGLPAARPVLLPATEVTFQALAYRLAPEARLTALLRRRSGEERPAELPVRLAGRAGAGAPDLEALTLVLTVGKIEAGAYELRLAAGPVLSPALPIVISPGSAGRIWPAVALPTFAAAPPEPVSARGAGERPKSAPARHHRFAAAPLQAAYLAALRPLAAGDEIAARSAVAAFEAEQLGSGGASHEALTSEDLIEVEAPVVGDLSRRDPEALVALLLLYERLYHQALEHRAYHLATHDGEVLFGLAELYAKQSHAAGAREIAAAFLAGLGQGPEPGLSPLARRALERSLTYDPGNEAALLGLAADAGWRGDVRAAALALERLLKHHPESPEGRLRLALCRARLGDPGRARQLLGEILAADPAHPDSGDPEPWLLSLAYQELARLQLAAGEAEPAARTVEAGLARLPGDEALQLEQAFLLDCRGEHGRAREVLAGLEIHPDEGGTPRHRYNQPPAAAFDRSQKALEARAAERQPAFAAAAAGVHREGARP
jgi:Tfp pilus assembly protein PilF